MKSKICFKCGILKKLDMFYKHPQMGDGHLNKCKECAKKDVSDLIEIKKNDKAWVRKERARCRAKSAKTRLNGTLTQSSNEVKARYYRKNPEKIKARTKAYNAIKDGKIIKQHRCSNCGAGGRIEMHHPDYSKPLAIVWLCSPCHGKVHRLDEPLDVSNLIINH